ncbi:MAG: DUF6526 family protein [Vicinamibacterales bacterium]
MALPQNFENHRRFVPLFHGVAAPLLVINLLWSLYRVFAVPAIDTIVGALLAIALIAMFLFARIFALRVQDRVIRLEMRLRLRELLPGELQPRIGDFTVPQLLALRFASDAELPALAATVLRDGIQDKSTIKKMVKDWQADELRA